MKTTNRWDEINAVILDHKTELKTASDYTVLKTFAETHGFAGSKGDFAKYKHLLKKIGVNYDELRAQTFAARDSERAQALENLVNPATVELWVAALVDEDQGSFAIVDADHDTRWYGQIFADDRIYKAGDLISAEQSAAEKAIWLASKALEAAGENVGEVLLHTTCPHLEVDSLHAQGARLGVKVVIDIDDIDERAVTMAETPGFMSWKESDLSTLVTKSD